MRSLRHAVAAALLAALPFPQATAAVAVPGDTVDDPYWTRDYDSYFQKYTKHYFGPRFEWEWFKAQAIAESGLKETAHSPTGASGLMQILPSTFREIRRENPHFEDIHAPRWNIAAGIYYDRQLYAKWREFAELQRLFLAFASYNAGLAGIRRACREAGWPADWQQLEPHVPPETRGYVRRIRHLKQRETLRQAASRPRGAARYYARARPGEADAEL
jgi:membrane-bound lytic murein transglycosylase F